MTPTGLSYATMHRLRTFGSYTALVSSFLAPASGLAAGRTCTLGESQQVKSGLGKRLFGIALGAGASSALLSWSVATDAVQLQPLGKDGKAKGEAKALPIAGARGLYDLRAVGDKRFLLRTHYLCDPAIRDHKCLVGKLVDEAGQDVGESARIDTNEWITTAQSKPLGSSLLTLFRTTYKGPRLVRFQWDGNALTASEDKAFARCYGASGVDAESPAGIEDDGGLLQIVADKWVVLHGADSGGESPPIAAFSCDEQGRRALTGMPAISKFLAARADPEGLKVLYSDYGKDRESGEPIGTYVATLSAAGKLSGAKLLAKGKPRPDLFDGSEPTLRFEGGGEGKGPPRALVFDNKGQQLGPTLSLPKARKGPRDEPAFASVWADDHFLLAYSSYDKDGWALYTAPLSCGN